MKDTIKIIKLDMLSIRPYYTLKNLIIFLALGVFYVVLSKSSFAAYGVAAMFALLFSSYPFLIGEESGIDTLYAAFGIKREKVVLGRYIWSNLVILTGVLSGGLLAGIAGILSREELHVEEHLFLIPGIFIFSTMVIALQYPIYFKYGYKKARTVVFSVFLFVTLLIISLGYLKEHVKGALIFVTRHPQLILGGTVVLWVLLYLGSIHLSMKVYKNRDLV